MDFYWGNQLQQRAVAREVFEDMPQRGNKVARDKLITFKAPRVSTATANELFDEKPLAEVIWDEELPDSLDSHGLLEQLVQEMDDQMQCELGDFNAPVSSECDDLSVVDGMTSSEVVWDDEIIHNIDSHDGLLLQLTQGGEYLDADEGKPTMQLFINDGFSEISPEIVIWDEDMSHDLETCDGLLQMIIGCGGHSDANEVDFSEKVLHNVFPADHGVVDSAQVFDEVLNKARGNLQSEEIVGSCLIKLSSTGVHDSLSSESLNNQHTRLSIYGCYGESVGHQLINYGSESLVPCEGRQVARCVCRVFSKELSWRSNGFSPGSYELKRSLCDFYDMQLSNQAFKSELFVDAYLLEAEYQGCISVWQWDPANDVKEQHGDSDLLTDVSYLPWVLQLGIATANDVAKMPAGQDMNHNSETFAISEEKEELSDLHIVFAESQQWMKLHACKMQEAHEILNLNKYGLYKVAVSIRRQWDPGIMKLHIM